MVVGNGRKKSTHTTGWLAALLPRTTDRRIREREAPFASSPFLQRNYAIPIMGRRFRTRIARHINTVIAFCDQPWERTSFASEKFPCPSFTSTATKWWSSAAVTTRSIARSPFTSLAESNKPPKVPRLTQTRNASPNSIADGSNIASMLGIGSVCTVASRASGPHQNHQWQNVMQINPSLCRRLRGV